MLITLASIFSACSHKPLETVQRVELDKYTGTWYEQAHLPTRFQKGCECTRAEYAAVSATKIKIKNSCVRNGKGDEVNGVAKVKDKTTNSKLSVRFFWPFTGKYWILDVAEDYSYALVGHPNRKYLWILSRDKVLNEAKYNDLVARAKVLEFPVEKLIKTKQACD